MNNSPLVTVYVTNYNYSAYIRQSLGSLFSQTMKDFEVIIIDDGSTDNSKSIIEEYTERAQIVFQKNKGLNVSNNIALKMATGKYIMRLDADDYLAPNALEVMSSLLEADPELGLVFPDYEMVDKDGNLMTIQKRHNFAKEVKVLDQPAHGACTMIRTAFLRQLGGYDERYRCQDGYELWIKFTAKYKVTNVNTPLFYYRQHGDNLTSNEERILNTRMLIKSNFAKENLTDFNALAIVPVRGSNRKSMMVAQTDIDGKSLLQNRVDSLIQADRVKKIVITSSSQEIGEQINAMYAGCDKVCFIQRPIELERMNVSLYETVEYIGKTELLNDYSCVLVPAIEFPFINSDMLNDAVNSLFIFKSDSLISVRPIENTIYQHDGSGMKPIVDPLKVARIERDEMYNFSGGIIVTTINSLKKYKALICGKVSHIVISQKASLGVKSKLDILIAKAVSNNSLE